jgi:hypothetical protein
MMSLLDGGDGDDDNMKALRAHSEQIDADQSENNNYDVSSDEDQWFRSQQSITAIERNDTKAWRLLGFYRPLPQKHLDMNGKVCD